MTDTIEEAVKNINIIDVEEFHNEVENTLVSKIKKAKISGGRLYFAHWSLPYHILNQKITNKYPLEENVGEFVEFCNQLFKKEKYQKHQWLSGANMTFLEMSKKEKNNYLYNNNEGNHSPLIHFGYETNPTFAFFNDDGSKNIEGIYVDHGVDYMVPHFIMTNKLYNILVGSQKDQLKKIYKSLWHD